MNALTTLNGGKAVTMTSLELVEFINGQRKEGEAELRHDHFMAKVPQVLGVEVAPIFRGYYKAVNGKQNPMYRFPKREACLMAMSYSYDLQAKVFDKMTELEQKTALLLPDFTNPAIAARAWADEVEKKLVLTLEKKVLETEKAEVVEKLAISTPKVAALNRISLADGEVNLQTAGKILQQQPNKFIQWLREMGWIYKRAGSADNLPRAEKYNAGYLTAKVVTITASDGSERVREQTMVTPKGLAKLATILSVNSQPELI